MSAAANRVINILLVEDNAGDVDLVKEAVGEFTVPHTLHVVRDGDEALAFLEQCMQAEVDRSPDLILLDLNIPRTAGREVLATIKQDERMKHIPVIVLTSSEADRELLEVYRLHANCFITKPRSIETFFTMFEAVEQFWLRTATLPRSCSAGHKHAATDPLRFDRTEREAPPQPAR